MLKYKYRRRYTYIPVWSIMIKKEKRYIIKFYKREKKIKESEWGRWGKKIVKKKEWERKKKGVDVGGYIIWEERRKVELRVISLSIWKRETSYTPPSIQDGVLVVAPYVLYMYLTFSIVYISRLSSLKSIIKKYTFPDISSSILPHSLYFQ